MNAFPNLLFLKIVEKSHRNNTKTTTDKCDFWVIKLQIIVKSSAHRSLIVKGRYLDFFLDWGEEDISVMSDECEGCVIARCVISPANCTAFINYASGSTGWSITIWNVRTPVWTLQFIVGGQIWTCLVFQWKTNAFLFYMEGPMQF